jgi:hypothetical protein
MEKIDFKRTLKGLNQPSARDFTIVDVPEMQFIKVDGEGDPDGAGYADAVGWLYAVAYATKLSSKSELGRDYVVPPLEGLWWAGDLTVFADGGDRNAWSWTMMILQPEWVTQDMHDAGLARAAKKLGEPDPTLRLEPFHEGLSVQILHIGPYSAEAPTIARLHQVFLPENGLVENGNHHEIYLGDPGRTPPDKLKTVLRQPVKRVT